MFCIIIALIQTRAAAQAVPDGRWAHAILRVPHESQALLISRHPWRLRRQLELLLGYFAYPVGMRWCLGGSEIVKAGPTLEPISLMHATTFVKCNNHA